MAFNLGANDPCTHPWGLRSGVAVGGKQEEPVGLEDWLEGVAGVAGSKLGRALEVCEEEEVLEPPIALRTSHSAPHSPSTALRMLVAIMEAV